MSAEQRKSQAAAVRYLRTALPTIPPSCLPSHDSTVRRLWNMATMAPHGLYLVIAAHVLKWRTDRAYMAAAVGSRLRVMPCAGPWARAADLNARHMATVKRLRMWRAVWRIIT